MGESDRYQDYRKRKRGRFTLGQDNNALMNLFILNVIFFLIMLTLQVAYFFYQQTPQLYNAQVVQWFELPANLTKLSERPWTLVTYMFSDTGGNLMRILSNMLWLWAFGYILQELTGNDKIIPVYIYGGLLGGIVFIAANYLIPPLRSQVNNAALLGANAGTIAVAMATTTLSPNHKFFTMIRGGIPIWVLMAVYLFIDFAGVASMSAAYSLSHLGGAFAGFLFVALLRRGKDGSVWMNRFYHWFTNLFTPGKNGKNKPNVKDKVFYNTGKRNPYNKTSIVTQQRVDEILDKINQRGYHFLTDEEKQILRKAADEEEL
ncbi:MAG: rhomboid family intramembrane serine protease [Ferruginibacter sp.]|nr:rhomboid family intramembrane serine protease [Ferruginibacter sp.]